MKLRGNNYNNTQASVRTTCLSSKIQEQYRDSTQHAIDRISGVGSARFLKLSLGEGSDEVREVGNIEGLWDK